MCVFIIGVETAHKQFILKMNHVRLGEGSKIFGWDWGEKKNCEVKWLRSKKIQYKYNYCSARATSRHVWKI